MNKPRKRDRHWLGLVFSIGLAVILGYLLTPSIVRYFHASLAVRDQLSSIFSLWVGVLSLTVTVAALAIQVRGKAPKDSSSALSVTLGSSTIPGMFPLHPPSIATTHQIYGREHLVSELVNLFHRQGRRQPRVQVLCGAGGIGKTTTALQVAYHLQSKGVSVWWISAAESVDLQLGMRQLARRLGATAQDLEYDWTSNAPDVLWRLLAAFPTRWLLVVDNADDPRLLAPANETVAAGRGWIRPPFGHRGALVVTTRDSNPEIWGDWCQLRRVEILSPTDSAKVLTDYAGDTAGSDSDAAALAARLGGLPLALELAGKYLADAIRLPLPGAITNFVELRSALDRGDLTAVFPDRGQPTNHNQARRAIGYTWELSLTLLALRGQAETRPMLRLLSIFADAPLPVQVVLDPNTLESSPIFSEMDGNRLRDTLDALHTKGTAF